MDDLAELRGDSQNWEVTRMTADSRTPTKKKQLLELAVTKRTGKPLRQSWRCVFILSSQKTTRNK
jgi:hypothetical protein